MTTSAQGYVYCIADEQRRVKLGFSQDVDARLRQLKTANADKLTILYRLPVKDMKKAEEALHSLFSGRILGEWFRLNEKEQILLKKVFGVACITDKERSQLVILGLR